MRIMITGRDVREIGISKSQNKKQLKGNANQLKTESWVMAICKVITF